MGVTLRPGENADTSQVSEGSEGSINILRGANKGEVTSRDYLAHLGPSAMKLHL